MFKRICPSDPKIGHGKDSLNFSKKKCPPPLFGIVAFAKIKFFPICKPIRETTGRRKSVFFESLSKNDKNYLSFEDKSYICRNETAAQRSDRTIRILENRRCTRPAPLLFQTKTQGRCKTKKPSCGDCW